MSNLPILEQERGQKRKAEEIADSEDEGADMGSEDDLGLSDGDFLNDVNEEEMLV